MQKFLTIFFSKNIAAVDFVSTVRLNKSSTHDFVFADKLSINQFDYLFFSVYVHGTMFG